MVNIAFHIISDTACDLSAAEAGRLGVTLVSFYATLDGCRYYREEQDISTHDFYQMMVDHPGVFPKTSTPTVDDYLSAFRPKVAEGTPILCICINGSYSSSVQSACIARDMVLEESPGAQIHVMDSQLVTVLQGELVREACLLRDQGHSLEEVIPALESVRSSGRIFFTTDDLEYLHHGGRIGRAAATTGAILNIKPIIGYVNQELVSEGHVRGRKNSLKRVQELFWQHIQKIGNLADWRIATGFGLDQTEYTQFAARVFDRLHQMGYESAGTVSYQIGITIGVHTGPTPIGIGLLRRTGLGRR